MDMRAHTGQVHLETTIQRLRIIGIVIGRSQLQNVAGYIPPALAHAYMESRLPTVVSRQCPIQRRQCLPGKTELALKVCRGDPVKGAGL